ncbi:hypothetical protein H4R18_000997 [Coemansia javaensis]|uniref:Uncharacterized protein n=1 Tax=Coemansia javaensis TaxID=2761396 RepID=A0A9W8LLY7_9FUNG|nr:hypothetical protein H4R18_000997 [Coemansia javaensis]
MTSCGYECDCMDLYYDHLIFDAHHLEMARQEAMMRTARESRRTSRAGARRGSAMTVRKQASEPAMEPPKRPFAYGGGVVY